MTMWCCVFDIATLFTVDGHSIVCASTLVSEPRIFSCHVSLGAERNKQPIYYIPHVHLKIDFPT